MSLADAMEGTVPPTSLDNMLARSLAVLEWKYRANTFFYPNLDPSDAALLQTPDGQVVDAEDPPAAERRACLREARKVGLAPRVLHEASRFGLTEPGSIIWFDSLGESSSANDLGLWNKMKRLLGGALPEIPGAFGVVVEPGRNLGPKVFDSLQRDLAPVLGNWAIAQRLVSMQQGVATARADR
jgi:hypothetical protein